MIEIQRIMFEGTVEATAQTVFETLADHKTPEVAISFCEPSVANGEVIMKNAFIVKIPRAATVDEIAQTIRINVESHKIDWDGDGYDNAVRYVLLKLCASLELS